MGFTMVSELSLTLQTTIFGGKPFVLPILNKSDGKWRALRHLLHLSPGPGSLLQANWAFATSNTRA